MPDLKINITVDDKGHVVVDKMKNDFQGLEKSIQASTNALDKQGGAFASLKSGWVNLAGGVYLAQQAWSALQGVMNGAELGTKVMQTEQAFAYTAKSLNINATAMIADLKRVTNATVDDSDLMQKAMKAMSAGMKPDDIVKLGEVARFSARRMGVDVSEAFYAIIDAVEIMRTKTLKSYGLITGDQAKLMESAKGAGAEVDAMRIIMLNYASQAEIMGKATENQAEQFQQYKASVAELREEFSKLTTAMIGASYEFLKGWSSEEGRKQFTRSIFGDSLTFIKDPTKFWGLRKANPRDIYNADYDDYGLMSGGGPFPAAAERKAKDELDEYLKKLKVAAGAKEAKKDADELASATARWQEKIALLNPYLDTEAKRIIDLDKESESLIQKFGKQKWITEGLAEGKAFAAMAKDAKYASQAIEDMNKSAEEQQKIQLALQTVMSDNAINAAASRADMQKALIDLHVDQGTMSIKEGIEARYQIEKKLLDVEAQRLRIYDDMGEGVTGETAVKILQETTELQQKRNDLDELYGVDLEKNRRMIILQSASITDGLGLGYEDLYKSRLTWSQAAYNFEIDTYRGMADGFQNIFYDALTGDMKDLSDYWDSMWKSMARSMSQQLGQMMSQWIMFGESGIGMGGQQGGMNFGSSSWGGLLGTGLKYVSNNAGSWWDSIGSWFGGGSSSPDYSSMDIGGGTSWWDLFHSGGIVGQSTVAKRYMSESLEGVPRLHSGLASDEFPAILQAGETVIPKGNGLEKMVYPIYEAAGYFSHAVTASGQSFSAEIEKSSSSGAMADISSFFSTMSDKLGTLSNYGVGATFLTGGNPYVAGGTAVLKGASALSSFISTITGMDWGKFGDVLSDLFSGSWLSNFSYLLSMPGNPYFTMGPNVNLASYTNEYAVGGYNVTVGPNSPLGTAGGTEYGMDAVTAHTGGVIGTDYLPESHVSPRLFIGAPRLHDGLAPDEFPTILQKGETVIPRGGSQKLVIENLQLVIGGKEFTGEMKAIADGVVVDRNKRAVLPTSRVYQ